MSAEAIARLERTLAFAREHAQMPVVVGADLRALLDAHAALEAAHTEALDALQGLTTQPVAKVGWSQSWDDAMGVARAILAKAGRREMIRAGWDGAAQKTIPRFVRATPLTATPLADEIAALRASNARFAQTLKAINDAVGGAAGEEPDLVAAVRALRARVAELEAQLANDAAWAEALSESAQRHMNGRESYWLAQRTKWIAEHDRYAESCKWHADRAEKAESERDALKLEVESLVRDMVAMTATANAEVAAGLAIAAERDALWTQVASVALLCVRAEDAEQLLAPDEVLAAMDEAKP